MFDSRDFVDTYRKRPQDFTRQRHLDFKTTVLFLLNQPNAALQTELDQFFRVLHQAPFERRVVTAQALSKARAKIRPEVFEALNQALQQQLDARGMRQTWRGLRLLAVDGSTAHLPLETEMERFFGTHQDVPVARLSALFDVGDGQALHSLITPLCTGERGCVQLHLDHAPPNSLILFDRGYPAHWLFAYLQQQGCHFVMRLPSTYNKDVSAFLRSGLAEQEIISTARRGVSRQACEEAGIDPTIGVRLRLIRVALSTGEEEVLATSLHDCQTFPAADFADLYHQRWGVESEFRRLKQTMTLENFSGRSPDAVKQDFHATQFVKNLAQMLLHSQQAAIDQRHSASKHRWKANFTQGVSRLKNTLVTLIVRPCATLMGELLTLLGSCLSAIRPGRSHPRQRRHPATHGCEGYKPTR